MGIINTIFSLNKGGSVIKSTPNVPFIPQLIQIVVDGNSLSNYGSPCFPGENYGPGDKWPTILGTISPWNTATILNYATSGQNTLSMINGGAKDCGPGSDGSVIRPSATLFIDPLIDPEKYNILITWEVANDIASIGNVTDAYNRIVSYCQARRAAGFKVLVVTMIKWRYYLSDTTAFGDTWEQFDAKRLFVNNQIRNNWESFADGICDLALENQFLDPYNATYYVDGIHLNGTGRTFVANYMSNALLSLI
jgi:hypothetical protein